MEEEEQNIICNFECAVLENMWQEPLFIIEILSKYHIDFYDLIGKKIGIKK